MLVICIWTRLTSSCLNITISQYLIQAYMKETHSQVNAISWEAECEEVRHWTLVDWTIKYLHLAGIAYTHLASSQTISREHTPGTGASDPPDSPVQC